jgi:hypothetical protein
MTFPTQLRLYRYAMWPYHCNICLGRGPSDRVEQESQTLFLLRFVFEGSTLPGYVLVIVSHRLAPLRWPPSASS